MVVPVSALAVAKRHLGWVLAAGALALSACGGSSTPSMLTQSDIPSYLDVKVDDKSAFQPSEVQTAPCKGANGVVFDGSWRHLKPGPSYIPTVTSIAISCSSVSQAQRFFVARKIGGKGYPGAGTVGHSVPGIGDEAWFIDDGSNAYLRDYSLVWRQNDRVSSVAVEARGSEKRITPALVELLARRVAARS